MGKRNTVRINMDLLDGYLKAKNIHPKDFCEKQLGFSDGWYYGILKNGGHGVKVLVAQLIARSIGVEYETLVIPEEDTGRKKTAGASPRPTETREEKTLFSDYVDMEKELEFRRALLEEARLEIKKAYEQIDELKQENVNLSFKLEQAGACFHPTERAEERGTGNPSPTEETGENRKHSIAELLQEIEALKVEKLQLLGKVETREAELEKVSERLAIAESELKRGVVEIRLTDLLQIICYDLLQGEIDPEFVRGYLSALNSIFKYDDIRKE